MKSYKIWILFILLSVVIFGTNDENTSGGEPNGNGIGIWIESVGFNSEKKEFELIIKSRTGDKFGTPVGEMKEISIETGVKSENPENVSLVYISEVGESPKVITTFSTTIPTTLEFTNLDITIRGVITITDTVGNQNAIDGAKISFGPFSPKPNGNIELKIYEKLSYEDNWTNNTTDIEGEEITVDDSGKSYIFTKGGSGSFMINPIIYILGNTGSEGGRINTLNVQRNNDDGEIIPVPFDEKTDIIMSIDGFKADEKNTVTIIPISPYNVKGSPITLNFIVDTQINNSYLGSGIIGELDNDGNIQIDLSKLIELSGVTGYNYTLKVGDKTLTSGGKVKVNGKSYLEPSKDSNLGTVKIPMNTSGFIGGSKGTLLFTVYDSLGHKKTFEKTYFIPKESDGITAKVSGEVKQRKSKIKIITEGNKDKFRIGSSIDESSEKMKLP